jgi:hypothetical protein
MLSVEQFDEAHRLLADGLTFTAAHERTGLAMGTLHRIATGKMQRPDPKRIEQRNGRRHRFLRSRFEPVDAYECHGCGYRVNLRPCNICASREIRARQNLVNGK